MLGHEIIECDYANVRVNSNCILSPGRLGSTPGGISQSFANIPYSTLSSLCYHETTWRQQPSASSEVLGLAGIAKSQAGESSWTLCTLADKRTTLLHYTPRKRLYQQLFNRPQRKRLKFTYVQPLQPSSFSRCVVEGSV
jgi:hypothetical protein